MDASGDYPSPSRALPLKKIDRGKPKNKSASTEPAESEVPLLTPEGADSPRSGLSSPDHHLGAICEESVEEPDEEPTDEDVPHEGGKEDLHPVIEEESPERDVPQKAEDKIDLVITEPMDAEPEPARENPTFVNNDEAEVASSPEPKTPSPEPEHSPDAVPMHRVDSNKGMLKRQGNTLDQPEIAIDLDSLAEHSV